jgi:hypothetical protein
VLEIVPRRELPVDWRPRDGRVRVELSWSQHERLIVGDLYRGTTATDRLIGYLAVDEFTRDGTTVNGPAERPGADGSCPSQLR